MWLRSSLCTVLQRDKAVMRESITLMARFLLREFSPLHKSVGGLTYENLPPLSLIRAPVDTDNIDLAELIMRAEPLISGSLDFAPAPPRGFPSISPLGIWKGEKSSSVSFKKIEGSIHYTRSTWTRASLSYHDGWSIAASCDYRSKKKVFFSRDHGCVCVWAADQIVNVAWKVPFHPSVMMIKSID